MRFPSTGRGAAVLCSLVAATLLAAGPALADEPAKPAEAATPAATQPAPVAGGLTEADITRAFKKYRKQVRDGNTVYCRTEKPVGTRIGKQVCYTADQVLAAARAERDARDQLSQMNVCGAGSCTPGG
jgi:hypothetical protein